MPSFYQGPRTDWPIPKRARGSWLRVEARDDDRAGATGCIGFPGVEARVLVDLHLRTPTAAADASRNAILAHRSLQRRRHQVKPRFHASLSARTAVAPYRWRLSLDVTSTYRKIRHSNRGRKAASP